jgi:NAD(P)-dependent dehydrogenase (short-subunit alcohol dehydrogenase family)
MVQLFGRADEMSRTLGVLREAARVGAGAVLIVTGEAGVASSDEIIDLAQAAGPAAQTEEIAEVIVFLASPRASYVTGAVFAADGGRTAV